ncbi:MAG: S-adenosylmethionine:tRNA ribosyltransferase-isomerase [Actinomycetota bacterium]|nr:S-adenosylmethionine:tRNA ribosyltransferase-isomerase [Actinomycetota bacterium]
MADAPLTTFTLPRRLAATEPPEARGLRRDQVRMLVSRPDGVEHARFNELSRILHPGDLVVINTSATRAAAVDGIRAGGEPVVIHFSTPLDDGWIVELRARDGSGPIEDATPGETFELPYRAWLRLEAAHPDPAMETGSRLWRSRAGIDGPVEVWLGNHGRPISYGYLRGRWPLADYQTVFARDPASAEMPSAARPFTRRLVTNMVTAGINLAPVVLHCGVSSLETGELPQTEWFRVPPATAWLMNETRKAGGRVIAVGTTVTRAIETVSNIDGSVTSGQGWTDLVLGPNRPARAVDALITGWHPPRASHLLLLEAVAGAELVQDAYDAAITAGYLWHEFGDSCLILPAHGRKGHP